MLAACQHDVSSGAKLELEAMQLARVAPGSTGSKIKDAAIVVVTTKSS